MKSILPVLTYCACTIQVLVAVFALSQSYSSRDMLAAALLLIVPVIAVAALRCGPDREERRLQRAVNKARLRKELQSLEEKI